RDHLELDRDRRWQRGDFNSGARGIRFAGPGKIFGVKFVIDREIFFHVGEKNGDIDDVAPLRAGVFHHESHILKYGATLRFDVVAHDVAGGIERHSGDFLAPADAWSDAGEKEKIADTLRVRKRTHRLRPARTFEGLAHDQRSEDRNRRSDVTSQPRIAQE